MCGTNVSDACQSFRWSTHDVLSHQSVRGGCGVYFTHTNMTDRCATPFSRPYQNPPYIFIIRARARTHNQTHTRAHALEMCACVFCSCCCQYARSPIYVVRCGESATLTQVDSDCRLNDTMNDMHTQREQSDNRDP